jgi:hypothetical protein
MLKLFKMFQFLEALLIMNIGQFIQYFRILPYMFSNKRCDWFNCSVIMKQYFGYMQKIHKDSHPLYVEKKHLYLYNHRDIADIFIDLYTSGGDLAFLSRWGVAIAFPLLYFSSRMYNSVFYFRRGKNIDKEKFNSWLYKSFMTCPYNGLIIYPEGTRRHSTELTELKNGSFHFAYKYSFPIQIIINKNKEFVLSLKNFSAQKNVTLYMYRSEVIYPEHFDTVDAFIEKARQVWAESWNKVYSDSFKQEDYIDYKQEPIVREQPFKHIIWWNIASILGCIAVLYAYPFNLIYIHYLYKIYG